MASDSAFTKPRILVIEDDPDIVELLQYNLDREGYQVWMASDGETGIREAERRKPSLILLDLMLPKINGLEVARLLKENRATKDIPLIMVTAKGEESDVVLGLGLGADDYIRKPFSPKEVAARVRAVLRRASSTARETAGERLVVGPIAIDPARYEVRVNGEVVPMTRAEFRLLHSLAGQKGRVLTRDQLLDKVTGGESVVIDRNVDVHIGTIRRKLGSEGSWIVTVRGVGYKIKDD